MITALLLVGFGLILALGGVILLDRERFDRSPRAAYRLATVAGAALMVAGIIL